MRAENWLEAELELEQLALEQPAYPGPHVNLALVYLHDGRRDDARAALERALEADSGHAAANTQLGIMLREEGKFAEAEAAYRRALATDPEHAVAHYNLGVLLDIYLRRTAEALEHYEAIRLRSTQPNETVGRWIIDLRRRVKNGEAARVAQGEANEDRDCCRIDAGRGAAPRRSRRAQRGERPLPTSRISSPPSMSARRAWRSPPPGAATAPRADGR